MNTFSLLLVSLFAFVAAAIYVYIGRRLQQRHIPGQEARLAWQFFTIWWFGLATTTFLTGFMNLLGMLNLANLVLLVTLTHINLLSICVALCGLLYYLLYLFTGNKRLFWPLIIFYFIYYASLVYYITAARPIGVTVERWRVTLQYQNPLVDSPFFLLILVFLLFPQIIGSLAYFSLYFKVRETTQKYRVMLVSWSIIIWFCSAFLVSVAGLSEQDWWQIVSRVIGLMAAFTIFIAYFPPAWVKRKYGIAAINE